ncbi:carbonic anhydrase [Acidicapsa ligni]|uniref:carbonic anhydrase n=1 Tax=Acidicapsa ligni TaxID=542300 RepID=UPI0021DF7AD0|nr:carbonic anhydrase family protein [Acidicapsa ligni]
MRRVGIVLLGLCMGAPLLAQQAGAPWGYEGKEGPLNWGKLDPAYKACASGKEQSPIDIRGAHPNRKLQPIEFHYISGTMALVNNGHTIQITPPAGSYIVVDGVRYDLVQFHFHHPGEEAVKGALPDMSLHLVHKSADGRIVVVAVRLNEGNPNAVLAALWQHLPKTVGATDKLTEEMNPAGLLPADRAYWTYEGSLTAPPCTEGVRWLIFKQPVELSRSQLRSFATLYKVNSRLIQATRGRKIQASE